MKAIVRFGIVVLTAFAVLFGNFNIAQAGGSQLVVGLYPWVPRPQQFEAAIRSAWSKVHPDVSLVFLSSSEWDGGYTNDPPAGVDVFVFDAMYLDYFRSMNFLEPMTVSEVQDLTDFVPYAINGVQADGRYYAIPQLGCANILLYLKDDAALASAKTLSQVGNALSQCTYTSKIPPDRRGLMVDMAGKTTNGTLYLDAAHSIDGKYPLSLPPSATQLNRTAIANLRSILGMASYENGTAEPTDQYQRGAWFSNGWGRAVIGYTEYMSDMSEQTRQRIAFKVMPLSDNAKPPLFYADVVGVNTATNQRGTRDLAVQLANVMAASSTMISSIGSDAANPYPQFLMATRPSVFQALGKTTPIYNNMYELVTGSQPLMFKVNSQSRQWFGSSMPGTIRDEIRQGYRCGCDFRATQAIANNSAAQQICQETCASHGGWNSQWTNDYPAAEGWSVCGCNACPAQ